KPCGPDAPTLASSRGKIFHRRWWQESPVTKESAEETVKTIARGMPGVSGVTVVTNSRVFFYTRGCGCVERPAFPAPSVSRGRDVDAKLARNARRDREAVSVLPLHTPSFRDAPLGAGPESILPAEVMDSGLALRAPRNDEE